jgi:hypothetical protein
MIQWGKASEFAEKKFRRNKSPPSGVVTADVPYIRFRGKVGAKTWWEPGGSSGMPASPSLMRCASEVATRLL